MPLVVYLHVAQVKYTGSRGMLGSMGFSKETYLFKLLVENPTKLTGPL